MATTDTRDPEPDLALEDGVVASPAGRRSERIGTVVAVGLAVVGLLGALIAWRVVDLGSTAGGASHGALSATRERSQAELGAETRVSMTWSAWIEYELDRRRASDLRELGHTDIAAREDKAASAHWGFVDPAYIGSDRIYRPDDHVAGIVAGAATQADLDPAPHLEAAIAAEARTASLTLIAVVVAGALPFLTLAEVGRGRVRTVAGIAGAGLLAGGLAALLVAWA